ncbi:hypothetical protein [Actinomadura flavalba]|uniref:hypothetical protein n=1 Tax=Actinomadura flavalba TaxID=1120938 RepID=UPI0003666660|nr:hypothetical protein [Actinomadura flavalba]
MSCDHLVCAQCSHPVRDGRCPTCRNARAELHGDGPGLPPALVLGVLLVLLLAALVLRAVAA